MFIELIKVLALFLSLTLVLSYLYRSIGRTSTFARAVIGALFGLVAVVGMASPMQLVPGAIIDPRSVLVSLSGFFFGPIAAATAFGIAGGFRIYLGGVGSTAGVALVAVGALSGVAFYYLRIKIEIKVTPFLLFLMGFATHICALFVLLLLPENILWNVFAQVYIPFLVLYPLATVMLGLLVQHMDERFNLEHDLFLSQARFRTLVEAIPDSVWLKDPDGIYLSCNKRFEKLYGAKQSEIVGKSDFDFAEEKSAQEYRRTDKLAVERGSSYVYEEWVTFASNGQEELLESIKTPIYDSEGHLVGVLGIGRDITDRKRGEEALVKERNQAANILEGTHAGTWEWDIETSQLTINERWAKILGYRIEELMPVNINTWIDSIHPDDYKTVQTNLRQHFRGEVDYYEVEFRQAHREGGWVWINIRGKIIERNAEGKPRLLSGTLIDVTKRKEAELRLLESEALFRDVFQLSPIAASISAVEGGRYFQVNEAYSATFGWSTEQLLSEESEKIGLWPNLEERHAWVEKLKRNGYVHDYPVTLTDSTGEQLSVILSAILISFSDEPCVLTMLHDVTEREQAEVALAESESRYRTILESIDEIGEGLFIVDSNHRVEYMNQTMINWFGDQTGETCYSAVAGLQAHCDHCELDSVVGQGKIVHYSPETPEGQHFEIVGTPIKNRDGSTSKLEVIRDITKRKESEKEIRILSQVVEQSPVSVMITDTQGSIQYVNNTFEDVTGYSSVDIIGENPRILKSGETPIAHYQSLWQTITSGQSWQGEFQNRKKNGEIFWERANIAPVLDETGKAIRYLAVKEDITLQKEQEERILKQAHFDSLTDLPNRFLALDRLTQLVNEANRTNTHVAVLFLDLDDFKKVNDTMGHEVGDRLLIEAAARLKETVRSGDTVGRLGGDEFIVLLGSIKDATDARTVAESLLERFRDPFDLDGRELVLTASVGISIYPNDGEQPDQLLRNADAAMYQSKDEGRNTYHFYTEAMNEGVARRLLLEEQLRGALERGEFQIHYQPQVNIVSRQIIGAEALLRWSNPALGNVSPVEFIPIAEQTGFIVPIGQYVLSEALKAAKQWNTDRARLLSIAINISPRQFRDPNLVSFIEGVLCELDVSPNVLELEITEGVLMSGHAYIDEALSKLNDLGITISMDDFGTGYSSLSYLRSYPFDILKIDRSFINDITVDSADQELVNATIAMAHGLGLKVVAEGVETEAQLELLAKRKCDIAQGYLFSKPVSKIELEALLLKGLL